MINWIIQTTFILYHPQIKKYMLFNYYSPINVSSILKIVMEVYTFKFKAHEIENKYIF